MDERECTRQTRVFVVQRAELVIRQIKWTTVTGDFGDRGSPIGEKTGEMSETDTGMMLGRRCSEHRSQTSLDGATFKQF